MRRLTRGAGALCAAAALGLTALAVDAAPVSAAHPGATCAQWDPTSPGTCVVSAVPFDETIRYPDPAWNPDNHGGAAAPILTAHVPAINEPVTIDAVGGPNGTLHKRLTRPGPCSYYRTFDPKRIVEYPAPDQFKDAGVPATYWIPNIGKPPPTRSFLNMQLPSGIGWVELPHEGFVRLDVRNGVTARYDSTIKLGYFKPDNVDDVRYTTAWEHRNDSGKGWWWTYQCSFTRYNQVSNVAATPWELQVLDRLHAENPYPWEFWRIGQENPPPPSRAPYPVPDLIKLAIPDLHVQSAPPPDAAEVKLRDSLWIRDDFARYPITVRDGGDTAVATPGPLQIAGGVPSGAPHDFTCSDGGTRNPDGNLDTDCWIRFPRSTPQGHPLKITFRQTWRITLNGRPVAGADGTVTRQQAIDFTIRQTQATGGN